MNVDMKAPDDLLYEYAVVRYVPRVDREEFINIGLIMMCKRRRWMKGRIFLNEPRLRALDPTVRIDSLQRQASVFERSDVPFPDIPTEEKYRWLAAVKSAVLQTSPSHPGVAPDRGDENDALELEFDRLFLDLVM